ncbi:hypothetical protein NIES4101_62850 [Calothrix sp. NIES-4101]|nr:hypothetical protein NIES4101_62850 [Calothrix sp. NIES-4101]
MTLFSRLSQTAAVAAILATTLAANSAHAQQSYPMTCRGGGTISIRNDGGNGVRIRFQPGGGAATQGLSPGQCTWSDRALRAGEPTTICDDSASAAQYVSLLVQSNQYAIMQVYNDGQGCMKVTRVGP